MDFYLRPGGDVIVWLFAGLHKNYLVNFDPTWWRGVIFLADRCNIAKSVSNLHCCRWRFSRIKLKLTSRFLTGQHNISCFGHALIAAMIICPAVDEYSLWIYATVSVCVSWMRRSPWSGISSSCPAVGKSSRTGRRSRWHPLPADPEL